MSGPSPAADFFSAVRTLPELLARRAASTPSAAAYYTRDGRGRWQPTTWSAFHDDTMRLAAAFGDHGVARGTRVGILAATSLEWESAQMAALACGATVVGIDPYYPDALIDELAAGVTHMVLQDAATLARLSARMRSALRFAALVQDGGTAAQAGHASLATLRARAQGMRPSQAGIDADTPALVAFSSGSTGSPKPIVYTHGQVLYACRCIVELYPEVSADGNLVCWLPLANLFQRMINFAAAARGVSSYVVEDPRRVLEVLPIANPEVFVAVPRFCERLYAGVMERVERRPLRARVMRRAIALGGALREAEAGRVRLSRRRKAAARIADRLVLARVRAVLGRRLRFIVTGSAPMPRWLLGRFDALGIPVLEAYGASENLVPIAANRLAARKPGTVGQAVGDNELRIAADGEVQVRGRGVFLPQLAGNAARAGALTADGFLATGDLGALDAEGFLTLHGRRGDTFKTAQGRWISLAEVEDALRRLPGIEHAAALRMPDDRLAAVLARAPGAHARTGAVTEAALRTELARELAGLPPAMRPVAIVVAREAFSPASGELTTNLKLRRGAIAQKYAARLHALIDRHAGAAQTADGPRVDFL